MDGRIPWLLSGRPAASKFGLSRGRRERGRGRAWEGVRGRERE